MLFIAIGLALIDSILCNSLDYSFNYKFCDNSWKHHMIDRVFQTPTTIYMIRNSMVYPIVRKKMPLIVGSARFWVQNMEAFHIKHLFLGIDLTEFESGFTITLDTNMNLIRDFKNKPNYYITIIFSQQNYYIFKELSNNSFVLSDTHYKALPLGSQGSIKDVFGIEAPVFGSYYRVLTTYIEGSFSHFLTFSVFLLSNDNMFYSYVLHKSGHQLITQLKAQKSTAKTIDDKYPKFRAKHITGIVVTNTPYIIFENTLIDMLEPFNLNKRIDIWENFDCNYFNEYLPKVLEYYKSDPTLSPTIITELSTIIVKPKQISYWPTIIVLTLMFLFFGFVIFVPLLGFRQIRKDSNQSFSSKEEKKL